MNRVMYPEAEDGILGAVIRDNKYMDVIAKEDLSVYDFYLERSRTIFGAMWSMWADHKEISVHTLADYLVETGQLRNAGGYENLVRISAAEEVPNAVYEVRLAALVRSLVELGNRISEEAMDYDKNITEIFKEAEKDLKELEEVAEGLKA